MTLETKINDEQDELTLRLKVIGRNAAFPQQEVLMYGSIEDPEKRGFFESFTCTLLLDISKYYSEPSQLKIMNYNGEDTFNNGSDSVKDRTSYTLNEGD